MSSHIKTFKVNAEWTNKAFDFETATKQLLGQFDEWRQTENPILLSINFGQKDGIYIEEDPHYCYLQALYIDKY